MSPRRGLVAGRYGAVVPVREGLRVALVRGRVLARRPMRRIEFVICGAAPALSQLSPPLDRISPRDAG